MIFGKRPCSVATLISIPLFLLISDVKSIFSVNRLDSIGEEEEDDEAEDDDGGEEEGEGDDEDDEDEEEDKDLLMACESVI